jgi:hypothetical protein
MIEAIDVTITVTASEALSELVLTRWGNRDGTSFAERIFGAALQHRQRHILALAYATKDLTSIEYQLGRSCKRPFSGLAFPSYESMISSQRTE